MTLTSLAKTVLRVVVPMVLAAGPSRAGTIEVAPVSIDVPPGTTTATVTVTNHNPVRTAIQIRGFAWSQDVTTDQLTRTDGLIVSPPIFQLEPNEVQTIRLMVRQPPSEREATYRLLVDELPSGGAAGTVQFALRLSLPMFAQASQPRLPPALTWRIVPLGGGQAELRVRNEGSSHERVTDLMLKGPGFGAVKPSGLPNPYVLAGAERSWRLNLGAAASQPGTVLQLSGRDLAGQFHALVPVGDR